MRAAIGLRKFGLVGLFTVLGLVVCTVPVMLIYRRSVIEGLR